MAEYIEKGKVYKRGVNVFGSIENVDSATDTDIWAGANATISTALWVPPTEARVHAITSSDTADDADEDPAETGAFTVLIKGLDSNWAEISETVTLNGTANVNTVNSYIRINEMRVVTSGTDNVNAGNITATAATDATITAVILAGKGRTQQAIYSVPANYKLYVNKLYASMRKGTAANVNADVLLYARGGADAASSSWTVEEELWIYLDGSNVVNQRFDPPLVFEEKTDVRVSVEGCSANDTAFSGGFDGWLEFVPS